NDRMIQRNIFREDLLVLVAVNFRRRRENQLKLFALLNFKDIAGSDDVRRPKRVVILFAIDASEFGGEVIYEVVILFDDTLQLPEIGYVSSIVFLLCLMLQIDTPNVVSSGLEFLLQRPAKCSHYSGDQYFCH